MDKPLYFKGVSVDKFNARPRVEIINGLKGRRQHNVKLDFASLLLTLSLTSASLVLSFVFQTIGKGNHDDGG